MQPFLSSARALCHAHCTPPPKFLSNPARIIVFIECTQMINNLTSLAWRCQLAALHPARLRQTRGSNSISSAR
jgi:hypothetical protein